MENAAKKKLLFVLYNLGAGGAEKSFVNLMNCFPPDAYHVDVLLFSETGMHLNDLPAWVNVLKTPPELYYGYAREPMRTLAELRYLHIRVSRVFWTALSRFIARGNLDRARQLRWMHSYRRLIPGLSGHYDVAASYLDGECMYYLIDKVEADRKLTWRHNDYRSEGFDADTDRPYYRACDEVIAISDECGRIFREVFPEDAEKCIVLPNITSEAQVRQLSRAFDPSEYIAGVPAVLSIGRLAEQKGYDIALRAFALLKQSGVAFHYYIIGAGKLKEELEALRHELGLDGDVTFLGLRENPYPYIRACDVVLQSSRWEGKSMVLDEAKIIGKPILATRYPTVGDQLSTQEGMVVDMTPEAVAKGLAALLGSGEQRDAYSAYLLGRHYGNESVVEEYLSILKGAGDGDKG